MTDSDSYDALRDLAAHAGALVVNAGGSHEAELLQIINREEREHFREVQAREVAGLVRLTPHPDLELAVTLEGKARLALPGEAVVVQVAEFEPADRPVLWWPANTGDPPAAATLVLNSANGAVKRLLGAPHEADLGHPLRALFVTGLLDGRTQPTVDQVAWLRTALLRLIDESSVSR
jgi:hypothetical protein